MAAAQNRWSKRSGTGREGLTVDLRRRLPPFSGLRSFEAVATCGGIRKAADAMSADHATVSRQLRALETWAGVRLFDRAPGADGKLTPEGEVFYRKIAAALVDIAKASVELTHRIDTTELRLWCAPGFASEWLAGRLGDFNRSYTDIELALHPTEDSADFSVHQADARIYFLSDYEGPPAENPIIRRVEIARPPVIAVASPRFVEEHGAIRSPADLQHVPLLHEHDTAQWQRWFAQHEFVPGELSGTRYWQGHLTLAAAREGQGVALANLLLVEAALRAGTLVEIGFGYPVYLGSYLFEARRDRWRDKVIASFRRWFEINIRNGAAAQADLPLSFRPG